MLQAARNERVFNAFRRSFGPDLESLERDWHHFMSGVQTPLEQYAPTDNPAPKHGTPASRTSSPKPRTLRGPDGSPLQGHQ